MTRREHEETEKLMTKVRAVCRELGVEPEIFRKNRFRSETKATEQGPYVTCVTQLRSSLPIQLT